MMNDWSAYQGQLLASIKDIGSVSPSTIEGFQALDGAAAKSNVLDAKTRELIAMAVAVTTRCDGCIAFHTAAAAKAGASKAEMAEALTVAIALNAGAALVYSARAMDAFNARTA